MASPLDRIKAPRNRRAGLIGIFAVLLLIMIPTCMATSIGSGEQGVKYSSFSGTNLNTQSLTPQFLRWQGIEATRELAESENARVVIIGGDGDGLPLILGE